MLYELQGTIHALGEVTGGQSRNGGYWQKREVVVETNDGNYTVLVALTAFGDRVEDCDRFQEGDEVKVKFTISAREYNGRYYTDVNLVSIRKPRQEGWSERLSKNGPQPARPYPGPPASAAPAPAPAPAPAKSRVDAVLDGDINGAGQDDDLPF